LTAKVEKLRAEVERKKKNEDAVLTFLRRAIRNEEESIAEWATRIGQLKAKM
jgi:hypothetical protein